MDNVIPFQAGVLETLASVVRPVKYRLAVVPVKEETDGIILIPSNANQVHRLGIVVAIGDQVNIDVKIGHVIIYQLNRMFESSVTHYIGEGDNKTAVMIMHQGDAFAKVDGRVITLDKFQILGDWILASDVKMDMLGGIFLPDSAIPPPEFKVVQLGNLLPTSDDPVLADLKVGDNIYLDKSRSNQTRISGQTYYYVLKQALHGVKVNSAG